MTDKDVAAALASFTPAPNDVVIYTAETDTNKFLGRPGQVHTGKVS